MGLNEKFFQTAGGVTDFEFKTVDYTGNSSGQAITTVGFQPDLVWIKAKNNTSHNALYDSVRGPNEWLSSNLNNAQFTTTTPPNPGEGTGTLASFDSGGFTLGNDAGLWGVNRGYDYIAWCWKASNTTETNDDGSATSTVSVSNGFSIAKMTFAGEGSIGHGLGVTPELVFLKGTSAAEDWQVYSSVTGLGEGNYLKLSTSDAVITRAASFSTVNSTVVTNNWTGGSIDWIMYSFVSIAGKSKIGYYTGNANATGPIVTTGFQPSWLLIKNIDSTESGGADWIVYDDVRSTGNPRRNRLWPSLNNAAATNTEYDLDFNPTTFQIKAYSLNYGFNNLDDKYLYMAIA